MDDEDKLVTQYEDFKIIEETTKYVLGYLWEHAYLYNKMTNEEIFLCEFYGICDAGVINDEEDWCVVGGDIIAIWSNGKISIIDKYELKWVNDIRIKNRNTVEILIDPWSNDSAIWELNVEDNTFRKIRNFDKYKERPYTVDVEW
jgi:hypothetical protein